MPQTTRRMFLSFIAATALTACNAAPVVSHVPPQRPALPLHPNETPDLRRKINHWADFYDLPRLRFGRVDDGSLEFVKDESRKRRGVAALLRG